MKEIEALFIYEEGLKKVKMKERYFLVKAQLHDKEKMANLLRSFDGIGSIHLDF
jgi:sulfur relay (sulfurtransferase) DsrF/TusC family protein